MIPHFRVESDPRYHEVVDDLAARVTALEAEIEKVMNALFHRHPDPVVPLPARPTPTYPGVVPLPYVPRHFDYPTVIPLHTPAQPGVPFQVPQWPAQPNPMPFPSYDPTGPWVFPITTCAADSANAAE